VQIGGDLGLADRDPQALLTLVPLFVVDESHRSPPFGARRFHQETLAGGSLAEMVA
jgi:hypothetical protein